MNNMAVELMALMLMQKDVNVCICHVQTQDLARFTIATRFSGSRHRLPSLVLLLMTQAGMAVIEIGINHLRGEADWEFRF
ncbi:MAG TPA: hypothetical protein VJ698_01620 [Noviherbaspirillum sp.]|uniref:hypothetical protein n=1 Tax=Noviherbaspirillum sp. TaxID=1926288 RepID=UPI002B479483|nr:hypothetical protein [Noviherbaspirillum sp.]HJV84146.1 hypothetical protein [Noviherbaspirillum sp.]